MEDTTFITNENNKKLKYRIAELINQSKELKFLAGFFISLEFESFMIRLEIIPMFNSMYSSD